MKKLFIILTVIIICSLFVIKFNYKIKGETSITCGDANVTLPWSVNITFKIYQISKIKSGSNTRMEESTKAFERMFKGSSASAYVTDIKFQKLSL